MTNPKFSVRWVYQRVERHGQSYEAGQKPALCFRGRKYALCVAAGHPVRVLKRLVADFDRYREVVSLKASPNPNGGHGMEGARPYTIEHAVAKLQELGARNGITAGAAKLLDRAATLQNGIDEDEFDDEEETAMNKDENTAPVGTDESTEEKTVSNRNSKKVTKKAGKAKVAKKAAKARTPKGPSRISRAVEYMTAEVKKEGGQKALERGWRKELFERTGKKFDLAASTCSIQYNKQVLNK